MNNQQILENLRKDIVHSIYLAKDKLPKEEWESFITEVMFIYINTWEVIDHEEQ